MLSGSVKSRVWAISFAVATLTGFGIGAAGAGHAHQVETPYFRVVNEGGQSEINACQGGLTHQVDVSDYLGLDYYSIHNECGGALLMNLGVGAVVEIEAQGQFMVVELFDVLRGDDASVLDDLVGEIMLQTCHDTGNGMRVIALNKVGAEL